MKLFDKILEFFKLESTKEMERLSNLQNNRQISDQLKKGHQPLIFEEETLIYAAMCEKHAREKDYMKKLGILEEYENE